MARAYQTAEEEVEQTIVIVHEGCVSFAERYDAGLVLTVSIIEKIFES
jgi:hypothetical protein